MKAVILAQLALLVIHGQASESSDLEQKIIEGDILADKKLLRLIGKWNNNRQKKDVLKGHFHLWKGGLIPYVISREISEKARKVIRRAFRKFASKTCIRFIPKQVEHKDYVHFIQDVGCYSSVGRKKGRQVISLGPTCQRRAKAVHEIMHALGFFHEHSRHDRDDYVNILYGNIAEGQEKNFISYSHDRVDSLSEPYDYKSIMHYENKAFTKNGKDTIQAKNNPNMKLGQGKHLSKIDIRQIKKLYKCEKRQAKSSTLDGSRREFLCKDSIPGCKSYTEKSDSCESNFSFMKAFCAKSCGFCGDG